jgi:NAD(P)H-dependent FMN reductase
MKNALDWMVATAVFLDKPVALWNASPRASIALAALRATLKVNLRAWWTPRASNS